MNLDFVKSLVADGQLPEAEEALRSILSQELDLQAIEMLAGLLKHVKRHEEAIEIYNTHLRDNPSRSDIRISLAMYLAVLDRNDDVINELNSVLHVEPNHLQAIVLYGVTLEKLGHNRHARSMYERALAIDSNHPLALLRMGMRLRRDNHASAALGFLEKASQAHPNDIHLLRELAAVIAILGDAERLLSLYTQILKQPGANAFDYSNLVFSLHYSTKVTGQLVLEAAKTWTHRYASQHAIATPYRIENPDSRRRLRVGYICSDLREHPCGRLLSPILRQQNRECFETFCYHDSDVADALTGHLKELTDQWRNIHGLSDSKAKDLIIYDQIDILVELNGYFGNHRLSLFARRPAPVQISALGYCNTTGLAQMDYRITDERSDPTGETDQFHTEKLLRIPDCCWCYQPWDQTPQVQAPPYKNNGVITFGNLNNPIKTSNLAAEAWAAILKRVPNSRLLLLAPGGSDIFVADRFAKLGIARNRLILITSTPRPVYLDLYNMIDIVLDPFPFNGDNTTCDALWMGVPVVALLGTNFWSRRGFSHLAAVGHAELVANNIPEYVSISERLASDPHRLQQLRQTLRESLINSPLGDASAYASKLESAYRTVWEQTCGREVLRSTSASLPSAS